MAMMDPEAEWRDLLLAPVDVEEAMDVVGMLDEALDNFVGNALLSATDNVLDALVRGDSSPMSELLEPLVRSLESARRVTTDDPVDGLGQTACATLLASTGYAIDPPPVLEPWIPSAVAALPDLSDNNRTTYALACAALGFDGALSEILRETPPAFVPRQTFGPDARAFAQYVSAAASADAPLEDFSPAFTSSVAFFPVRLDTGGLRWSDLLFGAYGAFHRVARYEPGQVLEALRTFVRKVAFE